MAQLYPDIKRTRVIFASGAEEAFYRAAAEQLADPWQVYYSRTLSRVEGSEGMVDNEIDFVLYHPQLGVVIVEVKGGRIKYDGATGQFASINRHGEEFSIKNPFQQALVWKSRFWRMLQREGLRAPVSHAVCLPSVAEDELPTMSGIEPTIIIGRERIRQLDSALRALVKRSQPEQYLRFADIGAQLENLLGGGSFATRMYLRDYIDSHELRVKDIEIIHESLITPIAAAPRLAVEGEAGTGKTMLAILLAKHFRDQGKRVVILSSNAMLNLYLKRELNTGVDVSTYAEVAGKFGIDLSQPPRDHEGKKEDWIQYVGPEKLKTAIAQSTSRYDVMICDEAQDVQPFWWEAIEQLIAGVEDHHFYVLFDRSQGVFGSGGTDKGFVPEDVLPIEGPYFPLVHNYRTTREIATFSRAFRTGKTILQSHCGRLGYVPQIVTYKDAADCRSQLGALVRRLVRDERIDTRELAILSARNPQAAESVLVDTTEVARMPLHLMAPDRQRTWQEAFAPRGKLAVSSIASFKGLETQIAIVLNLSEYKLPLDNPIMASLLYVAATRARHMLYVFVQEDDPKRATLQKALQSIETTGAMVLEGSGADYEFVGVVSHYNPDRIGWLKVDDPGFQRGSVMFFPSDVQRASIVDLKPGVKLVFRPRVEGFATIAADLRKL